jgi:hypothetical protein
VALALAASRVRFLALVRVRRPVVLLGAFVVAVLRLVERAPVERVVVLLRAVERRAAGLRAVERVVPAPEVVPVLLVVFVVAVAIRSAPLA